MGVFLQGNPLEHLAITDDSQIPSVSKLLQRVKNTLEFIDLGQEHLGRSLEQYARNKMERAAPCTAVYYAEMGAPAGAEQQRLTYYKGAQFLATRRAILARPRAFYERIQRRLTGVDVPQCWNGSKEYKSAVKRKKAFSRFYTNSECLALERLWHVMLSKS